MSNKYSADVCKPKGNVIEGANGKNNNNSHRRQHVPATNNIPLNEAGTNYAQRNERSKIYRRTSKHRIRENVSVDRRIVSKVSSDLSKVIDNINVVNEKKPRKDYSKHKDLTKKSDQNQTEQIKKILAECLQKFDENSNQNVSTKQIKKQEGTVHDAANAKCSDPRNPTLLRSYMLESEPTPEEYISKNKNVSNSLISSDSIHHSIYLESGREKRQCLLQYLSNVATEGQVVIYANNIPAVQSLLNFLNKHGFKANAVHSHMLMAESNWILSEFSLKSFKVLLCAEDHYHSCPAHFRWVKTIINYDLPIYNSVENWGIRNGIVDFSDNLPVHIYTFIKKSCPMDSGLIRTLHLDAGERDDELIAELNVRSMNMK